MDRVIVTGSSGLFGSRFVELFPHKDTLLTPTEQEFNLLNPASMTSYIKRHQPQALIHFAAYTDVSQAELQRGDASASCWQINVEGTHNLLSALDTDRTYLLYVSSDMVFSGSVSDPGPYPEDHPLPTDPAQVTWYGYSKIQAERMVAGRGSIYRPIYPVRAHFSAKLDYLRKPLSLYDQGKLYPLFTDQQLSLTFIDEACAGLIKIVNRHLPGIFHLSSPDTTSPYEIVSYLLKQARGVENAVVPCSINAVTNLVRYPRFGGLDSRKTAQLLNLSLSSAHQIVDALVSQNITA